MIILKQDQDIFTFTCILQRSCSLRLKYMYSYSFGHLWTNFRENWIKNTITCLPRICIWKHRLQLAFVRGIHRSPVNSPQKMASNAEVFPFDDVIMRFYDCLIPYKMKGHMNAYTNSSWQHSTNILLHFYLFDFRSLHWRHNDHDGVSNHQPHGCLLNRLFGRWSKKTSKLRVTGLCAGNSPGPVNSPHKGPVTRKMFPFDDVIMWWMRTCVPEAGIEGKDK